MIHSTKDDEQDEHDYNAGNHHDEQRNHDDLCRDHEQHADEQRQQRPRDCVRGAGDRGV